MLGLEGGDQGVSRPQGTPQAHCWLLRSSFSLQGQHGCAEEFCRSKRKTPKRLQIWCTHLCLPRTLCSIQLARLGVLLGMPHFWWWSSTKCKELQKILTRYWQLGMLWCTEEPKTSISIWCCRYGYKNYNYIDRVLNQTVTLPPLQQPHNSSIASQYISIKWSFPKATFAP